VKEGALLAVRSSPRVSASIEFTGDSGY